MTWPMSQDYNEAIQDPASSFGDGELRAGQPTINALGLPLPRSGNFADVYELSCPNTRSKWAVKCFTREVAGLRERYAEISRHLDQAKLPFAVDFQYLEHGIRVRSRWYPVLKMRWVEGLLLNEFVRGSLDKPALLQALSQIWLRMAKRLREAGMAHADLQHGNVLLVPGSKTTSLAVKLIDYDGMWVPALAGKPSGEVGHPSFQHPQRLREGTYSPEVDRFPLLAVATALHALTLGGRELWERYDNGDNLLFRASDFAEPGKSPLLRELWAMPDAGTQALTGHLALACSAGLGQVPLLEELAPEGQVLPLRTDLLRRAEAILGPCKLAPAPPKPAPAARPEAAAEQITPAPAPAPLFADLSGEAAPADGLRGKLRRRRRGRGWWWLSAGGGIAACVALVLAGLARSPQPPSARNEYALSPSTKSAGGKRHAPTTQRAPAVRLTAANGLHAELFRGTNFEQPVTDRIDPQVDWLWGFGAPDPSMPPDHFSIRWEGWLKAPRPGRYRLITASDDGVRLWLDDKLLIDQWHGQMPTRHLAAVELTDKPHALRIEYFEGVGAASLSLRWEQVGGFEEQVIPPAALFHKKAAAEAATVPLPAKVNLKVNGLRAELFRGQNFEERVGERIHPQVNWIWGFETPDPFMPPDHFSIRWEGWLKAPRPGRYRLITVSDDGVRLWLDDNLLIDQWHGQLLGRYQADVNLTDRPHALRIEYFEVDRSAAMSLRWEQIGGFVEEAVPPTALFHVPPKAP